MFNILPLVNYSAYVDIRQYSGKSDGFKKMRMLRSL